eukprot:GEMP01001258.1.p1 GENE.GEMP01001258.1~~GEMP01001258.1.p1  ORF type:complete len:1322 (+),score=362.06 GEMP01001258.1:1110-5075(+)
MDAKRLNKEICSRADWVDILDFVDNNLHAMDQVNLCTALHRSAKDLRSKSRDIPRAIGRATWENMLGKLSTLLPLCKPRELSNCVWALAVVDKKDEAFLEAWCPVASSMLPQYLPQNLSNTLWAVAKLQWCPPPGFLDKLVEAGLKQIAGFSPQDVANFNWSLVRMQNLGAPSAQEICPRLCQASMHLLPQFQPQNISNIIWSLATAQVKGQTAFIHATLNEGMRKLEHFKPQELANTMWALATLNIRADKFILAAIDYLVPQLPRTCCQDLSNTLWAIGFLKVRPRNELLRAIDWQIIRTIGTFSGQGLSNIIWGLAMLDYRDQMLLDAFTAELTRRLRASTILIPTDVSTILYSFAVLYWNAPDAIQLLLHRLEVVKCSARDVSNICWALASIGVRYDDLVLSLTDHLTTRVLEEMNVQGLCNTVWALCRFSLRPPRLPAIVIKHLENPEVFGPSDIFLLGDAVVSEWADLVGADSVSKVEKVVQSHYDPVEAFFLDKSNFAFDGDEARKHYRDAISNFSALRNVWLDEKAEVLSGTDASLVHKTVCAFDMDGEVRVVASGSPLEVPIVFEFCTIEHSRASDAEFQIVNILAAQPGLHSATLSVSEIPCISCMGALAQFRARFPDVALALDFDLRKVPGTPLVATTTSHSVADVVERVPPLQSSGSRLLIVKPPPAKSLMLAASPENSSPVVVSDDETVAAMPEDFRQTVRSLFDVRGDLDGSAGKGNGECLLNGVTTPSNEVQDGANGATPGGTTVATGDAARDGTGADIVAAKGAIGAGGEERRSTPEGKRISVTPVGNAGLPCAVHEDISEPDAVSTEATKRLSEHTNEKVASHDPISVEEDVVMPTEDVEMSRLRVINAATDGTHATLPVFAEVSITPYTVHELAVQVVHAVVVNAAAPSHGASFPTAAPHTHEASSVPLKSIAVPVAGVASAAASLPTPADDVKKGPSAIPAMAAAEHKDEESSPPEERDASPVAGVASSAASLPTPDVDVNIKSSVISVLAAAYHAYMESSVPTEHTVGAVASAISPVTARSATAERMNQEYPISAEHTPDTNTSITSSAIILPSRAHDTPRASASSLIVNGVDTTAPTDGSLLPSAAKEDAPFALPAAVLRAPVRTSSSSASSLAPRLANPPRVEPRSSYKDPLFRYTNQPPQLPVRTTSSFDAVAASRPAANSSASFPSSEPRGIAAPGSGFHPMRWSRDATSTVSSNAAADAAGLAGQQQTFYPVRSGRGLTFGMFNAQRFTPAAQGRMTEQHYPAGSSSSGEWRTGQFEDQYDERSREIPRQDGMERMFNDQMDPQEGRCGTIRSFYRR